MDIMWYAIAFKGEFKKIFKKFRKLRKMPLDFNGLTQSVLWIWFSHTACFISVSMGIRQRTEIGMLGYVEVCVIWISEVFLAGIISLWLDSVWNDYADIPGHWGFGWCKEAWHWKHRAWHNGKTTAMPTAGMWDHLWCRKTDRAK